MCPCICITSYVCWSVDFPICWSITKITKSKALLSTRPDTRQYSRGRLGRSRNAKTACNLTIFRTYRPTDLPTDTTSSRVACQQQKNVDPKMFPLVYGPLVSRLVTSLFCFTLLPARPRPGGGRVYGIIFSLVYTDILNFCIAFLIRFSYFHFNQVLRTRAPRSSVWRSQRQRFCLNHYSRRFHHITIGVERQRCV